MEVIYIYLYIIVLNYGFASGILLNYSKFSLEEEEYSERDDESC